MLLVNVVTTDGEHVRLLQVQDRTHLAVGAWYARWFPSLGAALHTLGGVIEWHRWTDESKARLSDLNGGRGAI